MKGKLKLRAVPSDRLSTSSREKWAITRHDMSDTLRKLNAYLVANEPRRDDAAEPPLTGRFSGSSPPAARGGNIMDDADAVGSPYTPDDLPSPALLPVGAPTTADPQQAPPRPVVPQKAPKVIERNAVACLTCRQAKGALSLPFCRPNLTSNQYDATSFTSLKTSCRSFALAVGVSIETVR